MAKSKDKGKKEKKKPKKSKKSNLETTSVPPKPAK
jgi:hypothetical protein